MPPEDLKIVYAVFDGSAIGEGFGKKFAILEVFVQSKINAQG